MFNIRKAISKFKTDFEDEQFGGRRLPSGASSARITSDDILAESADDPYDSEAISPQQKGSLFLSLQQNLSLATDDSSISIKSSSSSRPQSETLTPILGSPIPVDPMNKEFVRMSALLGTSRKKKPGGSISSNASSIPSIGVLPTTPSQHVLFESLQQNLTPNEDLPIFAELEQQVSKKPNGAHHDTVNDLEQLVDEMFNSSSDPKSNINDNDNNNQPTSETKKYPDFTPITQPPPLTSSSITSQTKVPGEFPLHEPSTAPSVPSKDNTRRKPSSSSMNPFLLALATPQSPSTLRSLEPIGESSDPLSPDSPSILSPEEVLARKMEQLGKMRRMESRNHITQSRASPEVTSQVSQRSSQPRTERPQLQTLQEDTSSDVATMLREAYVERQQAIQTQLDNALAQLRDVRADNNRLSNENQAQQRTISQLNTALDEAKQEQNSSVQLKTQLHVATSSLTVLNREKKAWQDKLDSMQHKVNEAERRVRCLDHLTRQKLESRQEAAYGLPKRRGLFTSTPPSPDVIGAMSALNEEIYQTCVQFVEGLERTTFYSSKQQHKSQVHNVLGDHLTAMMEDQAKQTTSSYNMLLMQAVLEVFMVHWCSSIIEAFYPMQESFADLLVELSAQTANTSGSVAICGKQNRILPSTSSTDKVQLNNWVEDIIKELGIFLTTAGLKVKTPRAQVFFTKTLALVKGAYDLRTAVAEKDICGGLEVVVVPPDTPFQEKWMTDAHADPRRGDTDHLGVDFVAGTSGIGLQRKVSEKVDGQFQFRMEMVLKPKVILARALNDD